MRASQSTEESIGRLNLLKRVAYTTHKYTAQTGKNLYHSFLQAVELGDKCWSDDFSQIEASVVTGESLRGATNAKFNKAGAKGGDSNRDREPVFFCKPYQTGECNVKSSVHKAMIRDRQDN